MSYLLRLLPRAEKDLAALDPSRYEVIKAKILTLSENPRPASCRKLTGHEGWRMRVGDYRVVYEIDDRGKAVTILRIGHRREIYR